MTSGGATSADNADWSILANRKCILWPDNDAAGVMYCKKAYKYLIAINCFSEIIDPSKLNLDESGDCVNWLQLNSDAVIEDILCFSKIEVGIQEECNETIPNQSQATEMVAFILELFDLFHDKNKEVYAENKTTREVYAILSRVFKDLITAKYYDRTKKSIRDPAIKEALSTIAGIGRHEREKRTVYRRAAKHEANYYLDLGQAGNSYCIEISSEGWNIIENPPVTFIRPNTMEPLPIPEKDGDFTLIWNLTNIPYHSQLLIITWIIEALRPDTPYPILELFGEQGSAKSTTQSIIRRIVDPNSCDLRAAPKQVDDIFVAAGANHFISYENISHLSSHMQDALCVIATGGGYAKRRLYTDSDEDVIHTFNPIIINGISASITAQDLVDRTISIELPTISKRTEITDIRTEFEQQQAKILGGLLNTFTTSLALLPTIKCEDYMPRLLEFVKLGMAVSIALGLDANEFIKQFKLAREELIARTIDSSPVAQAIIDWFEKIYRHPRTMPLKQLFTEVEQSRQNNTDAWPKSARGFGDAIRRAAPALRQLGILCKSLGKQGSNVMWSISEIETT